MIALASGRDWLSLFGTPQIHHRLCSSPRPWGSPCPQEPLNQTQSDPFVHRKHGGATTDLLEKVWVGLNGCLANTGAAQQRCDSLNKPLEATCEQVDVKGTKFYNHCFFLGFCVFSGLHGNIPEPFRPQCGSSHSGDSPCRYLGRTVPSLPCYGALKKTTPGMFFCELQLLPI